MKLSWLSGRRGKKRSPAPAIPPGQRVYAVGDVHGRLDLLDELDSLIKGDLPTAPSDVLTVFLGDYVDRGPHSAGVIERLSDDSFCTPVLPLRGNHEETLLQFLSDASVLDDWKRYGGLETLHSYNVDVGESLGGRGYSRAQEALIAAMPNAHRTFLESTRHSHAIGDYFFCHAGVRPGIALERQAPDDLLWIREEFLRFQGAFEKVIVHGHTPVKCPEMAPHRINVDTGAYASSVLTALVLEGATRRFLATGPRSLTGFAENGRNAS
ncbi:MAG: metallophosphoesterase family protein [Alphaproteobacteria bacterium]|nr:metallophosphoesterase family protein [Alphaproteobacteria bacterium]